MTQCGFTMNSLAQLGHVHVCTRPSDHSDQQDPDHYCRACNRFFFESADARRKQ